LYRTPVDPGQGRTTGGPRTKSQEHVTMKLGLIESSMSLGALGVILSFALGACSSTNSGDGDYSDGGASSSGGSSSGASSGGTDPPHALGVVALGESHLSGASQSTPYLTANFVPDSTALSACTTTVAGCTIPTVATCDGVNGHPLCTADQVCGLDSACTPSCITACTAECPTGEECYFNASNSQSCQPIQSFNAGALAFAGTTEPLTLYPPYTFTPTGSGSLFLAGASLEVQGAGSAGAAGFMGFDQKFTATTFLQTSPSLSTLASNVVWGTGAIPVGWAPGSDTVVVTVSGALGEAQCPATDSLGQFAIPRQVVDAVVGTGTELTIGVTRQHTDWNKSLKTQGTLVSETVQPVAFLEVETSSTESFSFTGSACPTGESLCTSGCVNVLSSATNCGTCGNVCPTGDYCSEGECYGTTQNCGTLTSCADGCQNLQTSLSDCGACNNPCPTGDSCINGGCVAPSNTTCSSCESSAETTGGTCASYYTTCSGDSNCSSYSTCVQNCGTSNPTCVSTCQTDYPTGMTEAENLQTCLCTTACETPCTGNSYCALGL
jgi:hypothetical protein